MRSEGPKNQRRQISGMRSTDTSIATVINRGLKYEYRTFSGGKRLFSLGLSLFLSDRLIGP